MPPLKGRTAGEKWFDWVTYGGIGYIANVVLSIGAIWAADRTHVGKRTIDAISTELAKLSGADYQALRAQVRYTSLLTGGFAVLAPIKWLEDHRVELVKSFDATHYQAIPDAEEILKDAHDRLEAAPQQSWTSVISSRFLAMVPFYAFTGVAMKENQWLARQTGGALFGEKLLTQAARGIDRLLHAHDPKALAELAEKQRLYPNHTVNDLTTGVMERPATALADYTLTEATTSSIVAGFLYGFTRLTAPFLGTPATQIHAASVQTPSQRTQPVMKRLSEALPSEQIYR